MAAAVHCAHPSAPRIETALVPPPGTSPLRSRKGMMRRLLRPLWILLALVFLFEAWLWDHLAPIVGWVVARIPLRAIKARLTTWIERLPPPATLVVFIVPVLLLLPLKILGLWMLAHGYWLGALGVLATAKVVSLGVTAFVFDLTRPKLKAVTPRLTTF